jgi:Sensors of blue-light using FAD
MSRFRFAAAIGAPSGWRSGPDGSQSRARPIWFYSDRRAADDAASIPRKTIASVARSTTRSSSATTWPPTSTQAFSDSSLKKLLMRARSNNASIDVAGMLLYRDGTFLQALEGDERSVRDVFGRIERDARHRKVSILSDQIAFSERRIFNDWAMGFANLSRAAQILKGFVDLDAGQDFLNIDRTQAMKILLSCTSSRAASDEPARV